MRKLALLFVMLAIGDQTLASVETILPLSSFRLESDGTSDSGKIVLEGKQRDGRVVELSVTAFGKKFIVPKGKLAQFPDFTFNGIRMSYKPGQIERAGRTIYIEFQVGWTLATRRQGFVAVLENGTILVDLGKAHVDPGEGSGDHSQKEKERAATIAIAEVTDRTKLDSRHLKANATLEGDVWTVVVSQVPPKPGRFWFVKVTAEGIVKSVTGGE
jgi:hypothetical protein